MKIKKYEELDIEEENNVVKGESPADVRFTEISPDDTVETLEIDKPTDTEAEKKKSAPKKALIVGGLALLLTLAAFLMVKSTASDPSKKNITVSANASKTAPVPGFNPEYASKNLMASNGAPNANVTVGEMQQQQNPANIPPGMKGNIPPYAPSSQSPIFGSTTQTTPAGANSGGAPNFMDIPVTQQGSAGAQPHLANAQNNSSGNPSGGTPNGSASFNSGSANAAGKAPGSGGGSRSVNSGYLSNAGGASSGGNASAPSEQTTSSAPASQSSYFLFAKAAMRDGGSNPARGDDYTASVAGQNNRESQMVAVRGGENARPPFGTMLPLQTLGAIDTLGQTQLVRMVLSRTMQGNGWLLERGTIFVGRAAGGRGSRAYVQVIGYLDNRTNSFVRIGGDLQGVDGAGGLQGDRKRIGSRWLKVLRQIGDRAYQTANTWISRNGSGTNITLPPNAQMGMNAGNTRDIEYVYVKPGSFGYLLVNDLPADAAAAQTAPLTTSDSTQLNVGAPAADGNYISDEQTVNLMSEGDAEKIKQNLPRIRPEYRDAVMNVLKSREP